MRAWTIVLFILSLHACLAMFNVTDITNVGVNVSIDTSGKGILVTPGGSSYIQLPNSTIFNSSPNATSATMINKSTMISDQDFISKSIETIFGFADTFFKLIATFKNVVFSIHYLATPYFGDFNAWVLEAIVDFILVIALFQMITGRSFKTME
jgi:hypothetical protein